MAVACLRAGYLKGLTVSAAIFSRKSERPLESFSTGLCEGVVGGARGTPVLQFLIFAAYGTE